MGDTERLAYLDSPTTRHSKGPSPLSLTISVAEEPSLSTEGAPLVNALDTSACRASPLLQNSLIPRDTFTDSREKKLDETVVSTSVGDMPTLSLSSESVGELASSNPEESKIPKISPCAVPVPVVPAKRPVFEIRLPETLTCSTPVQEQPIPQVPLTHTVEKELSLWPPLLSKFSNSRDILEMEVFVDSELPPEFKIGWDSSGVYYSEEHSTSFREFTSASLERYRTSGFAAIEYSVEIWD